MALSTRDGSITSRQEQYLKILMREAFSHLYHHGLEGYDVRRTYKLSAQEASNLIAELAAAKARGWKVDPSCTCYSCKPDHGKPADFAFRKAAHYINRALYWENERI